MDMSHSAEDHCDKLLYALKSLADMGETISAVRSIEKASSEILHIVLGTIGASKGALLTLDKDRLTVSAARGIEQGRSFPLPRKKIEEMDRVERTIFARWMPEFPEELKAFCDENFPELHVVVVVLLRTQNVATGLLLLSMKFMSQTYEEEDLDILDVIGRHVAVALYNFGLRRDIQATNFQLSRKVLHLETMHYLGLSVASFKPKSDMLQEVLVGALALLDAQKSFYLEITGDEIEIGAQVGVDEEKLRSFLGEKKYARKIIDGKSMQYKASRELNKLFGTSTFLAVPVRTSNKLFGTLAVIGKESRDDQPVFIPDDVRLLEAFATQAAVALENADMQAAIIEQETMKKELETAAAIQRRIVPPPDRLPTIKGYNIYGYNYPCREVGGDYFDIIPVSESRFGFVICDVAGKGLSAALLVSTLHASFHSLVLSPLDLVGVAQRVNTFLFENTTLDRFSTGFVGIVDIDRGIVETINAGHNMPLLLRASGKVERLETGGLGFGMFDFATYESQTIKLEPGDTIYLYTDGLNEALSPGEEEFGTERLEELVISKAGTPPKQLLLDIETAIREWTQHFLPGEGFPHDDFTQLAIQMQ
jgi:sigma-B regulation protein RsbU (phosphoserine phosphatase)